MARRNSIISGVPQSIINGYLETLACEIHLRFLSERNNCQSISSFGALSDYKNMTNYNRILVSALDTSSIDNPRHL